jgi:hypothetical protein
MNIIEPDKDVLGSLLENQPDKQLLKKLLKQKGKKTGDRKKQGNNAEKEEKD